MNHDYGAISRGWLVYSADGKRIGSVSEANSAEGYLLLQKGWFLTRDLYLPLEAIASVEDGSVRLRYTEEELESKRWDVPPRRPAMATRDEPTVAVPLIRRVGDYSTADQDDLVVPVHEEELVARRQAGQLGRVSVHKDVVEERQTLGAPLRHEEVYVERVPMNVEYQGQDAFREMEIEIPIMSDRLWVGKRAHVVEEVRVFKRSVVEEQTVTDTVRKERVTVEEEHPDGRA